MPVCFIYGIINCSRNSLRLHIIKHDLCSVHIQCLRMSCLSTDKEIPEQDVTFACQPATVIGEHLFGYPSDTKERWRIAFLVAILWLCPLFNKRKKSAIEKPIIESDAMNSTCMIWYAVPKGCFTKSGAWNCYEARFYEERVTKRMGTMHASNNSFQQTFINTQDQRLRLFSSRENSKGLSSIELSRGLSEFSFGYWGNQSIQRHNTLISNSLNLQNLQETQFAIAQTCRKFMWEVSSSRNVTFPSLKTSADAAMDWHRWRDIHLSVFPQGMLLTRPMDRSIGWCYNIGSYEGSTDIKHLLCWNQEPCHQCLISFHSRIEAAHSSYELHGIHHEHN